MMMAQAGLSVAFRAKPATRAKADVARLGGRVSYHGADMSKPAEIEAMVRACEAEFGAIDILVIDSTHFTTLFGGDDSLRKLWRNLATMPQG